MSTEKNYDDIITKHYKKIAEQEGDKSTSTMVDVITREKETRVIVDFVGDSLRNRKAENNQDSALIMDIGCGNGYTLEVLANQYPKEKFIGVEKTKELRELAISRFENMENVSIMGGDIRNSNFAKGKIADILICQRVIINLLNENDQKQALKNIASVVIKPHTWQSGGTLLFLESFSSSLSKLNEAREEFDLPAIKQAHHNLYLQDNFFDIPELKKVVTDGCIAPQNFLSTHYYVTRVLHPIFIKDRPIKRNSEFVNFFTQALQGTDGDYSPLKLYTFERITNK